MISRHSSISIATAMGLHVLLVMLVISGMLEHVHKDIEPPPVIIELIQPKKLEPPPPPPKPEPKKPEPPKPPKPEPVKPEPPKVVEQRPEPPKPEPAKPAPPAPEAPPKPSPVPAPAPTPAPAQTPVPAPSAPAAEPVAKPVPAAPAPQAKTGVNISASYRANNTNPVRSSWSQKNHEYGTVVLRVLVKSDGTAGSVEIKSPSDYPRLDQSAIQAVKTWRFNPATVDGKSIDEWYEVSIIFKPPNN